MPIITKEVKSYSISICSEGQPDHVAATVSLRDANGQIAYLMFFSPGNPLPPDQFRTDLGFPIVNFYSTALASIVDVLRNEKPVNFVWSDYMPAACYGEIETALEPLGESEPLQRLLLTSK